MAKFVVATRREHVGKIKSAAIALSELGYTIAANKRHNPDRVVIESDVSIEMFRITLGDQYIVEPDFRYDMESTGAQ